MPSWLSFALDAAFLEQAQTWTPPWGYPTGGGNSLGELTYLTHYSRKNEDGTKERWWQCMQRTTEGTYSILKDWCLRNRTPWDDDKAQRSAQEFYTRMFHMKWLPPGRGLWMMGTRFVMEHGSAALQNCAFVGTADLAKDPVEPFAWLMEASMLGIGVGFNTDGANQVTICEPTGVYPHRVADSREGWVSLIANTLRAFLVPGHRQPIPDTSEVRPAGAPIHGFGGTAAGPGPLRALYTHLVNLFSHRAGELVSSSDITDVCTMIAKCIAAGNVRRSALIALGQADDKDFLTLKDWNLHPVRMGPDGWGHNANHSVYARSGQDLSDLFGGIGLNGEPGVVWLDLCQDYGRLADDPNYRDWRAVGTNPCSEQTLESYELCTLVETFPTHHESLEDFERTLKFAYLYAKAVTLLPTHWPKSNEVMQRNRRIGCSVSGMAQFIEAHGWGEATRWLDRGYQAVQSRDKQYSEWLGIRESIKTTSVKPSGTVSILAGVWPGVHWPVDAIYLRRFRYSANDPIVPVLRAAGYHVEPNVADPVNGVVVSLPVRGPEGRTQWDVSPWEKAHLAALLQRWWADNQVSVTVPFQPHDSDQIGPLIHSMDGQLKSISFLPVQRDVQTYPQQPYERITEEQFEFLSSVCTPIDYAPLYAGDAWDAEGESGCSTDVCEIRALR